MLRRYQWWSLLLLNLNVIHTHSNWLCRKAQEKFQVESRFCKAIGYSYETLLATFLAKKKMFKVSNRNTRKRCLLISKITLKTSERRHLTTSYLPEVTIQYHVLEVFPRIYTNLQSSSTARDFNNSGPVYVILWENHYRNIWFMKNSKYQRFFFLKKQP